MARRNFAVESMVTGDCPLSIPGQGEDGRGEGWPTVSAAAPVLRCGQAEPLYPAVAERRR